VDPKDEGSSAAGRQFASRFFGVDPEKVELVAERYQPDVWAPLEQRKVPPVLNGNPADHLVEVLRGVEKDEDEAGKAISFILKLALGFKLAEKNWRLNLYEELSRNELLFQLVELLRGARNLESLSTEVAKKIGRAVTDEEVLLWLALGAASRKDERPLVRPVIHTFVRGMGGAVVTFPPNQSEPKLYLSAETVEEIPELGAKLKPLPVLSCTTCGQHYFEHWAKDFTYSGDHPSGGQAIDNERQYWETCDQVNGGKRPEMALGFYADVVAQSLKFQDLLDLKTAYSVGESLRLAGSLVLDMEPDDLQLLVIPQAGEEKVDLIVYDPMPGGSGLLKQMLEAWPELIETAKRLVETCPSACDSSCPDCLQRFRNAFYHKFLHRHVAAEFFDLSGDSIAFTHDVPPLLPTMKAADDELPVNEVEARLLEIIVKAGLPEPTCQKTIPLPRPFSSTRPDFYYEDPKEVTDGICIYLDGLSKHIHGNAATKQQDEAIRTYLQSRNYAVMPIPASHLNDPDALAGFLYQLARRLVSKSKADDIKSGAGWKV